MTQRGRGEETRAIILESAISAFAAFGYDGTGVAEICTSAGISKGAFYHHFESKQSLYLELLNDWLGSIDNEFKNIRNNASSTVEALIEMTSIFRNLFDPGDTKIAIFVEFLTRASRQPETRELALAPYRRYQAYFTDLIRQGVAEGTLRTQHPEQAATLLISMSVGLILHALIDPESSDPGKKAEDSSTLFIREFLQARDVSL